jgi:hypothetical protein
MICMRHTNIFVEHALFNAATESFAIYNRFPTSDRVKRKTSLDQNNIS